MSSVILIVIKNAFSWPMLVNGPVIPLLLSSSFGPILAPEVQDSHRIGLTLEELTGQVSQEVRC